MMRDVIIAIALWWLILAALAMFVWSFSPRAAVAIIKVGIGAVALVGVIYFFQKAAIG